MSYRRVSRSILGILRIVSESISLLVAYGLESDSEQSKKAVSVTLCSVALHASNSDDSLRLKT